jgi:hypothetical protein
MKLICTASKVSWFTVGREYEIDMFNRVQDDNKDRQAPWFWPLEPYKEGYRTEFLEDAEFTIAPEPVAAADAALFNEALLAAVVRMADEEGCRDSFDRHLATIRHRFGLLKNPQSQRAFLLALAYFAEEKSQ